MELSELSGQMRGTAAVSSRDPENAGLLDRYHLEVNRHFRKKLAEEEPAVVLEAATSGLVTDVLWGHGKASFSLKWGSSSYKCFEFGEKMNRK
uniref:Uncharacterized protein n=1 Tax=Macaca fascicularis TaxID=9541 RepID=Q9MZY6_MACFA|nr:hypothetical protein [Macaca fascicularis]